MKDHHDGLTSEQARLRSRLQVQIRNEPELVDALEHFAASRHWSSARAVVAILREKLLEQEILPMREARTEAVAGAAEEAVPPTTPWV